MDADRRQLMSTVGQDVAKMLQPVLMEIARTAKTNKESVRDSMHEALGVLNSREMQIDTAPIISAIETVFMGIQIPEPKVTVNIPEIKLPQIPAPDLSDIRGFMGIIANKGEVGYENPLPVQLFDGKGNPMKLFEDLRQIISGGSGGGKADFFTIKGFSTSAFAELMNPDGRIKVELPTGSSGLTDTELRASSVPVAQASGAVWSTAVVEIFGSAAASMLNGDNRLRVAVDTGSSGLTDAELRASSVPVAQASGASWSTEASIVSVSDIFSTTAASNVVNSDNRVKVELPATTVTVSGVTSSVAAKLIDSSGVGYDGSNPLPVSGAVSVTGSITSTVAVGDTEADAADSGSAPLKIGGIARTANPTAVANGDRVSATLDDLGRQLMRPVQVRDLTITAYAQLTTGTETTLLAASAGNYHDLIYVMAANNSDAAVSVDIRAVTAGGVVMTLQVPANGTVGIACPVPLPAQETGNNWTADMGDITGTTISLTALFSREI